MQTTLLGLAVAVIVALVTALVGPLMIDWGSWRATFETEATRLVGIPVRIAGDIDARLLPVPSLTLRRIEAGAPGSAVLRARTLEVELGLGALVRGEWRANELKIDGPDIEFGIDKAGALTGPPVAIGFDPDQIAIDRLAVEGARVTLVDAASGGRLVVEQATFRGEARSLLGPFKGEGTMRVAGQPYAYRLSGSRRGEDGGTKLRLNVDAVDRPLAVETDGVLWLSEALPRYDGTVVLSRPVGQVLSTGKAVANVPWRASGRVRSTSAAALIEQIEIQYGPDDQAVKIAGSAQLRFGREPRLDGVLSSRQIDADRWLAPDAGRRPPAALLAIMADGVSGLMPPLPVTLGIGIDNLTFGGAVLQAVHGDLRTERQGWSLDSLEFRAPGLTQVRMSGEIAAAQGIEFSGPAVVESADPRALVAWLEGRADAPRLSGGALSARGDLTLGRERIAVERLHAEFDRRPLDGRLAYTFAAGDRPARLEASISAPEFDIDAAVAFTRNAFAGAAVDRPGEVAMALDFGKATYAGVEARGAKAKLTFDSRGLAIDQMSIADVNGAKVEARGRIDDLSTTPRGSITLAIDAPRLDGAARLAGRLAPQASRAVQGLATRAAAARLNAKLDIGTAVAGSGAPTAARLAVDGVIGPVRVVVSAAGHGDTAAPWSSAISIDGRLESDNGAALAALMGIDGYAGLDARAARFTMRAGGRLDAALTVDTAFTGAGLDATVAGSLAWRDRGPKGRLDVAMAAADVKPLRRSGGAPVALDLAGRLDVDGAKVALSDIKGRVADSAVLGRLALTFAHPLAIDGHIDADRIELVPLLALALGLPADRPSTPMTEPFAVAPPIELAGRIAFSSKVAALTPALTANDVRGTLLLEPAAASVESLEGRLANGRLAGAARLHMAQSGVTFESDLTLTDAELSRLWSSPTPPSGRFTLQLRAAGNGRSPAALIGALRGGGTVTIDNLQAPGLDTNAIGAAIRAADQGVPADVVRIGDIVRTALGRGSLTVPWIGGGFTIADGRASFADVTAKARDADLTAAGSFDLSDYGLNLRVDLSGASAAEGTAGQRPRLDVTLKGPIAAPQRNVDVAALVGWLTLRSVERESKRLEAAEREAKQLQAIAREAKRREELEAARRAQEAGSLPQPGDTSAFGRLLALPPPIDIRPVPTDRGGRRVAPAAPSAGAPSGHIPETR